MKISHYNLFLKMCQAEILESAVIGLLMIQCDRKKNKGYRIFWNVHHSSVSYGLPKELFKLNSLHIHFGHCIVIAQIAPSKCALRQAKICSLSWKLIIEPTINPQVPYSYWSSFA
jgi:hypothetical protein